MLCLFALLDLHNPLIVLEFAVCFSVGHWSCLMSFADISVHSLGSVVLVVSDLLALLILAQIVMSCCSTSDVLIFLSSVQIVVLVLVFQMLREIVDKERDCSIRS